MGVVYNQTFIFYYLMEMVESRDIKHMACVERVKYLEKENKNLRLENADLMGERDGLKIAVEKLKEENQTLELWLDNKEKLNEEYRKQIDRYKRKYEHSLSVEGEPDLYEDVGD